jgi:hypothetical protein
VTSFIGAHSFPDAPLIVSKAVGSRLRGGRLCVFWQRRTCAVVVLGESVRACLGFPEESKRAMLSKLRTAQHQTAVRALLAPHAVMSP